MSQLRYDGADVVPRARVNILSICNDGCSSSHRSSMRVDLQKSCHAGGQRSALQQPRRPESGIGNPLRCRHCHHAGIATMEARNHLKQAKSILGTIFSWANSRTAPSNSALGKSLHYLKEQRSYLTNYLQDGRLESNNNRTKCNIKHLVIDRKTFFANTLTTIKSENNFWSDLVRN